MFGGVEIKLFPDIVTTLIGEKIFNEKERDGVFICARRDNEKLYSDEELDKLKKRLEKKCYVYRGDTVLDNCNPYYMDKHLERELNKIFEKYSSYKVIITDKFHGTIFSIIAGTPVIVIKTQDHKVSGGVEWFKGVYDNVYFAENLDAAYKIAFYLIDNSAGYEPKPYFKEKYYDGLKNLFDKTTAVI